MVKNEYWAKPLIVREQRAMFAPTLDDMIPDDHEVRLLDEVLRQLDWSEWEAHYSGWRGQPPIHPRVLAGIWLYALMRRIRTSRPVEYACGHNVDFIWLAEGLVPDHSTLADFFSKFRKELKSLFKQVCKIAMTMGLVRLGEVAFDGTRMRASNSRYRTLTTVTIQERLTALDQQIEQMLAEVQAAEAAAAEVRGGSASTQLPGELSDLTARRDKLQAALVIAKTLDEARRAEGIDPIKNPAQVPMTDLDSRVMPNKDGGYAPNYTPTCLTDGAGGFILDAAVVNVVNEHPEALPAVDRATEQCGEAPENFLADGGMATGPIMAGLEARQITGYVPAKSNEPSPDNPARRDDLTQPVPEELWSKLPKNPQGQLDKSCFVYVPERDEYVCPQGRVLSYDSRETRQGVVLNRYICSSCADCPLAGLCLSSRAAPPRAVTATDPPDAPRERRRSLRRDEHEEVRQRTAIRMATESGQQLFDRRSAIAETPFGYLKGVLGLRQFCHRGLEKVDHEWRWSCLSLNLKKLLRALARWRALALEALLDESPEAALAPLGA
jgi:transposase